MHPRWRVHLGLNLKWDYSGLEGVVETEGESVAIGVEAEVAVVFNVAIANKFE